jgi:hypothetical protein
LSYGKRWLMLQRVVALLLALVILVPAAAFAADETPGPSPTGPVGGTVEPGGDVSKPQVRRVEVMESHDIWRDLAGGFLLGSLVGGGVNQIARTNQMGPMIIGGAAIGTLVGYYYHRTGRGALMTVDRGGMKLAVPLVLPDEQRGGTKDIAVRMTLFTVNY